MAASKQLWATTIEQNLLRNTASERYYGRFTLIGKQKAAARAQLKLALEDVPHTGLPRVISPKLYQLKCLALFENVHERYSGQSAG